MGLKTAGEKLAHSGGIFGGAVHLSLHTGEPEAANELAGNGYVRTTVNPADVVIDAGTGRASNAVAVAFPAATGAWDQATHLGFWSAAQGGDLLISGVLASPADAIGNGHELVFAPGELTLDLATDD